MAETAASQLRRILHLIPLCEDDVPHRVHDVAVSLGTDSHTLLRDLRALSDRFDDPGGFVEGVQVYLEPDRFSLHSDHFRRPMRLTLAELGALDLGMAMLELERPPDEQDAIQRARGRLQEVIARLPGDAVPDPMRHADQGADADPEILRTLREGLRQNRLLSIRYASAGAAEATERTIGPLGLVPGRGHWFLVAMAEGQLRVYRVDRVEAAQVLEVPYQRPEGFTFEDVVKNGRVFAGQPERTLVVRYSARIAPWIAEREGKEPGADGTVTVEYPLGDADWAVRHVLQYGPDAEVISPAEVRNALSGRLRLILAGKALPGN